jgi:AcrR family transcriptional regulator
MRPGKVHAGQKITKNCEKFDRIGPRTCGFTQRALYYYFSNKEQAFRAALADRNDEVVDLALQAGKAMRAKGGSALDILAEILDVRYGETRRMLTRLPHTVELNAEAFKRCRDLMIQSAVAFQSELEKLIVAREKSEAEVERPLHRGADIAGAGRWRAGREPELAADRRRGFLGALSPDVRDGAVRLRQDAKAEIARGCGP